MSWTESLPLNSTSSILDLTKVCISKFELPSAPEHSEHNKALENRMADFKLWADGVGATAKPGASLDSRFRKRPNDLDLVKSILTMLGDFLDEYARLAESGSSTEEAICNVDSAMTNLAMIGVAIRRTGKASRSRRADRLFDSTKHVEFRRYLECIVLLRPSEDGRRPTDLDVSQLDDIQNRLIEANLRRRHRFLLAQSRSSNSRENQMQQLSPTIPSGGESLSESWRQTIGESKSKTNHPNYTPVLKDEEQVPSTITGFSTASTAEGSLSYTQAKRYTPEPAKTQITSISSKTEFPEPPNVSSDRIICKCPCCCQSIPSDELISPEKWKQHLIEDICPYTCIAENCPTPYLLFGTRKEWESHVKKDHPTQWQCPVCDGQDLLFPSMESIVDHIQETHMEELSNYPISTLLSWSAVQRMGIKSCPLCSSNGPQDSPEMVDHVLRHSYEFSLRALPWPRPIFHDLNKPVGTYNLPEKNEDAERLEQWIREAPSEASELLQLSRFDTATHDTPVHKDPADQIDYFATNDYFRDRSVDATSKRLEVQSRPSLAISQSSEDEVIPSTTLGIDVLYEGAENADVDVLAVHGLVGDSYSTWASGGKIWLRDLLPSLPEFKNARIMTFGYDPRLLIQPSERTPENRQEAGIDTIGVRLSFDLQDMRISARERPLIFIGHSLGGTVIKSALFSSFIATTESERDVFFSTKSVVFIGAPHKNFNDVEWPCVLGPMNRFMGTGTTEAVTEKLQRWADDFEATEEQFLEMGQFPVTSFTETRETNGTMVVPKLSACIGYDTEKLYNLDGDHLSICKFNEEDRNWSVMSERMRDIKQGIDEELKERSSASNISPSVPEILEEGGEGEEEGGGVGVGVGRGGGGGAGSDIWTCCQCGGVNLVDISPQCPLCGHPPCANCIVTDYGY